MKKEIIINNQIIKDLSQNSVQNNNEEFIFGYDKILDERGFYKKDGSLDINKILIYKEYLKYEYLDKLGTINILNRKIFKNFSKNKNLKSFLDLKNELKYIFDLLNKLGKFDIFNFWFEFNEKGFDENDTFWYLNGKNINDVEGEDIDGKFLILIFDFLKDRKLSTDTFFTNFNLIYIYCKTLLIFNKNYNENKIYKELLENFIINLKNTFNRGKFPFEKLGLFIGFPYTNIFKIDKIREETYIYLKESIDYCLKKKIGVNCSTANNDKELVLAIKSILILDKEDDYKNELSGIVYFPKLNEKGKMIIIKKDKKDILNEAKKDINKTKKIQKISMKDYYLEVSKNEIKKEILNVIKNSPHQQKISSFIKNSDSGSFLLSGYRGVGKTSLLKKTFEFNKNFSEFNKNNEEQIIPIFVNIPEPDENNKFSKKQLMNFIIRKLYKQVLLNPGKFPKKFEKKLEDQYIRTFKDVKNIEGELVVRKRGILRFILAILQYGLPFGFGVLIFIFGDNIFEFIKNIFGEEYKIIFENLYKNFALIQLITAFLVFVIGYKISFSFINVTFKSKIAQDLYDENIAEQKLTDNLGSYNDYLETKSFRFGKFIFSKTYDEILEKGYNIFALGLGLLIISYILGTLFLIGVLYLLIIGLKLIPYFDYFVILFFGFSIFIGIFFGIIFLLKKYFSRPRHKFVIVIDELDKLLDFDKNIEGKKKERLDMASIFDILGKLKILFFDTKGLLFFVVSNKESYDYHLKNKYREDDLVSNIFNRILYLPMNEKEKFNLNFSVLGNEETDGNNSTKVENNSLEKTFSQKELYNFNKWLYFKSHGNWRKMRFILNEKLENNGENNFLNLDLQKIEFENNFYDFFEDIYYLFNKKSLEKIDNQNILYKFLIGEENKKGKLISFIEGEFYKNYLNNIGGLLEEIFGKNIKKENNIYFLLDTLNQNIGIKENNSDILFKNIGFFISSISKLSDEMSFRDYILNNLLNFYEALNFYKKIDFKILFEKIKIDKNDLDYPAFEDFILYWLPFMLYYFGEKELINKNEFDKFFEAEKKSSTKKNNSLYKNNILKIYSKKEENILIDIFLKQSVDNLNKEGGFNLDFYEIKDDKNWRKFIKTKLEIAFGIITDYKKIDDEVFNFWRDEIIGKFLENIGLYVNKSIGKIFNKNFKIENIIKSTFYNYYNYNKEKMKDYDFDILKDGNYIFKYKIFFELFGDQSLENISEKYNFKIKRNFGLTESQMEDEMIGIEGIDYPHGGWGGFNNEENIMKINSISYSNINTLDDIKVIKEEWFN